MTADSKLHLPWPHRHPQLLVNLQSCKFDVVRQVSRELYKDHAVQASGSAERRGFRSCATQVTGQLGYDEVQDEQDDWHLLWSDLSVSA